MANPSAKARRTVTIPSLPPLPTIPSREERLANLIDDSVARFKVALGRFTLLPGADEWINNYRIEARRLAECAFRIGQSHE